MVRPGHRRSGGEQDQRVDERQVPRIEHLQAGRRPVPAGRLDARILHRLAGKEAGVEEGPEPGDEEHHLRGDEHDHAVAEVELHDGAYDRRDALP